MRVLNSAISRVWKRLIAMLLVVITVISTFTINVSADSNSIIATYISLARDGSVTDDALNTETLTQGQLRFLGVYASNFFVPFSTELGEAAGEETDNQMEQLAEALKNGLSFSDEYAQVFAENLMGLSRSSIKTLEFRVTRESDPDKYVQLSHHPVANNYMNFLLTMTGNAKSISDQMNENATLRSEWDSLIKGVWGYGSGDNFTPVFDCYLHPEVGTTASQFAFLKCLEAIPTENGYGFYVLDLIKGEIEDGDDIETIESKADALDLTTLGSEMEVDCFGNIIVHGLQHQVIAVPGCVNPFVWQPVTSDGTDSGKAGDVYQGINVQSMAALDNGSLYSSVPSSSSENSSGGSGTTGGNSNTIQSILMFSKNSNMYKKLKATKEYFDRSPAAYNGDNISPNSVTSWEEIIDAFEYVLNYADGTVGNSGDWEVYLQTSSDGTNQPGVYAKTKLGNFAQLNPEILKEDATGWSDENKHDKMEENLELITQAYQITVSGATPKVHRGTSRNDFINVVKRARNEAIDMLQGSNNDPQETDDSGASNVNRKSFTPKINLQLPDKLLQFRGADTGSTNFDLSWKPGSGGNMLDVLLKAFEQYDEINSDHLPQVFGYTAGSDGTYSGLVGDDELDFPNGLSDISTNREIDLFDNIVVSDNLGTFENGVDYNAFPVTNYVAEDGSTLTSRGENSFKLDDKNSFAAGYSNIVDGDIITTTEISSQLALSIYVSYLFASLYDETGDLSATIGRMGYRMASENLPDIPDEVLEISDEMKSDIILTSIRDWLYYLLHPTDGLNYVRELITNKLNAILVGWHNDMVGTNGVGAITGTTLYRSQTGYVTTPDLSEIQWTNSLIDFYNSAIPFLIVAMLITMLFAYITGILSLQRSIFGLVLFAVFLLMPVNLINSVVGTSNRISQNLYGEKFTYWALIQQESYSDSIASNVEGQDSYQNYLRGLFQTNNQVYSNQGSESIVLKWQAPKKMASLMSSGDSYNNLSDSGKQLLNTMIGTSLTGESYLDNDDAVYMYRSYLDISNFSQYIYRGIKNNTRPSYRNLNNLQISNVSPSLQEAIHNMSDDFQVNIADGYTNTYSGSNSLGNTVFLTVPISSSVINDAILQSGFMEDLTLDQYVGINQDVFNFSIPMFNNGEGSIKTHIIDSIDNSERKEAVTNFLSGYTEEDLVGLAAYSLYSENVFYYFSWNLYDQGMQPEHSATNGYKNILLGEDNAGYFYNVVGNGELKDFMNMKALFTYIIPYLKQCNDVVHTWDDTYGLFLYDGVPTDEGYQNDPEIQNNQELRQKYWHNLNVSRLYNLYTPWVDVMYDCSYADGEYISAMGERYWVEDPMNPASYPEERPMIFSESEMHDYGLEPGDLTTVEQLILDCNQGMEERMYELLNYFNFGDVTLNTAAAMNCAFEFNNTFSENGIFTSNHNIYPQSFELADFSYDAFLRFILANNTGEELNSNGTEMSVSEGTSQDSQDFYFKIVNNSSTTTAIVMLILDILSVYLLPAFKIFFIIAIFLASILIILSTAFRVDPEQKFIKKVIVGFFLPLLKFFLITIAFSYIVSLFMGVGNNAVTQTNIVSIQMGDPVIVMIAMIALDIAVLFLYYKVIKGVIDTIKTEGRNVANFGAAVFGGAAAMVAGAISGGFSRVMPGTGGPGPAGRGSISEEGTGVQSPRASRRAAKPGGAGPEDYEDRYTEQSDMRKNEAKRRTIDPDTEKRKMSEDDYRKRREDIDRKTKSGMHNITGDDRSSRFSRDSHRIKDIGDSRRFRGDD